jgi:ribonuclease HII
VDEAGRGCLSGPVCAAAVVWPQGDSEAAERLRTDPRMSLVRDSKLLSAAQRQRAREFIEQEADAYGVGWSTAEEVDEVNVLRASMRAMRRAIDDLHERAAAGDAAAVSLPEALLIDGNRFDGYMSPATGEFVPHACIVSGDALYLSIAAASILAKTNRDAHVTEKMHPAHPEYCWARNKGYGTPDHLAALAEHGPCRGHHRMTFRPVASSGLPTQRPKCAATTEMYLSAEKQ